MSHSCASLLCESPHRCDCNTCVSCHAAHLERVDIKETWADCLYCDEQIAIDISRGGRCTHGNWVNDGYNTDIPCPECEAAYEFAA